MCVCVCDIIHYDLGASRRFKVISNQYLAVASQITFYNAATHAFLTADT